MANVVRIATQVTGVGKASSELDNLRDKFAGLQKIGAKGIVSGVAMGAGIGAFNMLAGSAGAVMDVLGNLVKAGMEEEASISRLGASLKANVPNWDGTTKAIEKVIGAQLNLGFSDEEQRDSLGRLVAATHDVGEALDIQRTAMDLARFKRISLTEATEALTKVEAGSYRGLKSLGIAMKEGATATEALAAVQAVAAGQAEQYAQTTEGKLLVAQTRLNEKLDELGARTLPIVVAGIDALMLATDAATALVPDLTATTYDLAEAEMDVTGELSDATVALLMNKGAMAEMSPVALATAERLDDIAAASAHAAKTIGYIPPAAIFTRAELAKLAQSFKDTARAARDSRLDEAYDIAELPIKIREAERAVGDAQKELEAARTAAQRDAATLRLLEAQRELDNLRNALADQAGGFAALGTLLGTAYGRALFQAVAAWNRRTSTIPLPNPRYLPGGTNIDRPRGQAAGGPASGVTLVGEKGPEIVDLPAGSYVHSNAESTRMAARLPVAGGGGTTFYVTANLSPTGYSPAQAEQIANAVGPAIATYLRRRGLLVN